MTVTQPPQTDSTQRFWTLYLQEHDRKLNRWMHVTGTLASWIILIVAVWIRLWWLLLLMPLAGYGLAWLGHVLVERNRPLSIRYPWQSLLADYKLTLLMISGRDPGHVQKDAQRPSKDA
ncbi:MAG: DUF962 domain-containing protein [Planctomyces sp.]|nr:DUF962 domain-containing protein [Planctomyces sp.]